MPEDGVIEQSDYERFKEGATLELTLFFNVDIPEQLNPEIHIGSIKFSSLQHGLTLLDFLVVQKTIRRNEEHPFQVDFILSTIEESVTTENNASMEHVLSREFLDKAVVIDIHHELELFGMDQLFEDFMLPNQIKLSLKHAGNIEYEKVFSPNNTGYNIEEKHRLIEYVYPYLESERSNEYL